MFWFSAVKFSTELSGEEKGKKDKSQRDLLNNWMRKETLQLWE